MYVFKIKFNSYPTIPQYIGSEENRYPKKIVSQIICEIPQDQLESIFSIFLSKNKLKPLEQSRYGKSKDARPTPLYINK